MNVISDVKLNTDANDIRLKDNVERNDASPTLQSSSAGILFQSSVVAPCLSNRSMVNVAASVYATSMVPENNAVHPSDSPWNQIRRIKK